MNYRCSKCGLPILFSAEIRNGEIYHTYCVEPAPVLPCNPTPTPVAQEAK